MADAGTRLVRVPAARLARWVGNFAASHGDPSWEVDGGVLVLTGADGSWARLTAPFGRTLPADLAATALSADATALSAESSALSALVEACAPPDGWGVLLVRKGGFAIARLRGGDVVERKVGQRHVQGRTKAGGQSQQRFARRRENQAQAAYAAAAGHAARILAPDGGGGITALVTGGDRAAIDAVLADPRLRAPAEKVVDDLLEVAEPRGRVLDEAIAAAPCALVQVRNA